MFLGLELLSEVEMVAAPAYRDGLRSGAGSGSRDFIRRRGAAQEPAQDASGGIPQAGIQQIAVFLQHSAAGYGNPVARFG